MAPLLGLPSASMRGNLRRARGRDRRFKRRQLGAMAGVDSCPVVRVRDRGGKVPLAERARSVNGGFLRPWAVHTAGNLLTYAASVRAAVTDWPQSCRQKSRMTALSTKAALPSGFQRLAPKEVESPSAALQYRRRCHPDRGSSRLVSATRGSNAAEFCVGRRTQGNRSCSWRIRRSCSAI